MDASREEGGREITQVCEREREREREREAVRERERERQREREREVLTATRAVMYSSRETRRDSMNSGSKRPSHFLEPLPNNTYHPLMHVRMVCKSMWW